LKLEILLDEQQEAYAETKRAIITQRLTRDLLLLIDELRADDLKRTTFHARGISGDASIEIANKQEELKRAHDAAFPDAEELARRIQAQTSINTMIPREKP
jgi:hypothetical protein